MPLLSLVQELLNHKELESFNQMRLTECSSMLNANISIADSGVDTERNVVQGITAFIKAELHQLLSDDYYYKYINDHKNIPPDIALEIERRITPRIVNRLQHLSMSEFKKETLVRKCMLQILAEN